MSMSAVSASCVLRFPLELIQMLGELAAHRMCWLEAHRQDTSGEEDPSSVCMRDSSCSNARGLHSSRTRHSSRAVCSTAVSL